MERERRRLEEEKREKERIAERERQTRITAKRSAHETGCEGFHLDIDDTKKTVHVTFCRETFDDYREVSCRKGEELQKSDPHFCDRLLRDELARRGEAWMTEAQYWERRWSRIKHEPIPSPQPAVKDADCPF